MRRIALALLLVPTIALAVTATWTGKSRPGMSVTGVPIMNCEYQFAGRTFWQAHQGYCPATVEVQ